MTQRKLGPWYEMVNISQEDTVACPAHPHWSIFNILLRICVSSLSKQLSTCHGLFCSSFTPAALAILQEKMEYRSVCVVWCFNLSRLLPTKFLCPTINKLPQIEGVCLFSTWELPFLFCLPPHPAVPYERFLGAPLPLTVKLLLVCLNQVFGSYLLCEKWWQRLL